MGSVRWRRAWGAGILVGAALAAGAPARAADIVKLGDLATLSTAPLYVAVEKGYMKEEGIDLVTERFFAAAKMNSAFTAGELDAGVGTANAGLFNSVAQGFDVKIVADKGQMRPGYAPSKLMARKDLVDSGQVTRPRDFKGRKIALLAKGTVNSYELAKLLEHDGIAFKDVELVFLGPAQTLQAFATRSVDGAIVVEPWVAKAAGENLAIAVGDMEKVPALRSHQVAMILYTGRFIGERRPAAQRFMHAYVKGIEFLTKRGWQDDEVVEAVVRHTGVEKNLVKAAAPTYIAPDGRPDVASLARVQDWLHAEGMVPTKVSMDQVVDLSFLPPAR